MIEIYEDKLYVGKVKWFKDLARQADYGFVEIYNLGDAFIHGSRLNGAKISEDETVICTLQMSQKYPEKIEVRSLTKLIDINNFETLIALLESGENNSSVRLGIEEQVRKLAGKYSLFEHSHAEVDKIIGYVNKEIILRNFNTYSVKNLRDIINIVERYLPEPCLQNNHIRKELNSAIKYAFYCNEIFSDISIKELEENYFISENDVKYLIAKKIHAQQLAVILDMEMEKLSTSGEVEYDNTLLDRIELLGADEKLKKKVLSKLYSLGDKQTKLYLWQNGSIKTDDNFIANYILGLLAGKQYTQAMDLFVQLSNSEIKKLSIDMLEVTKSHETKERLDFFDQFIRRYHHFYSNIFNEQKHVIYSSIPEIVRIRLWLRGFNFSDTENTLLKTFAHLDAEEQSDCIVKLWSNTEKFDTPKCLSINTKLLARETEIKGVGLHIALQIIENTRRGIDIYLNKLVALVGKKYLLNKEIIICDSLFEHCLGRFDSFKQKRNEVPVGVWYCEGRKAISENTKSEKKSNNKAGVESSEREFWWCKNEKCHQNVIPFPTYYEKKDIKLFTILKRVKPSLTETEYSYKLGVINKVNRYIEHLKCRACNDWLQPLRETNYAKDRVNLFSCNSDRCTEKGNEIYINHCLNSRCQSIIDSRDTVSCNQGFYICNYCLGCCNSRVFETRKYIIEKTSGRYDGPLIGHKELRQIYCPKCGMQIQFIKESYDKSKLLGANAWLDKYKTDKNRCTKTGIGRNGKPWYSIRKLEDEDNSRFENIINNFRNHGYRVKHGYINGEYLIGVTGRSGQNILKCSNGECDNILNLNEVLDDDRDRHAAIIHHHIVLKQDLEENELPKR